MGVGGARDPCTLVLFVLSSSFSRPIYSSQTSIFTGCSSSPTIVNVYPTLPPHCIILVRSFLPRSERLKWLVCRG